MEHHRKDSIVLPEADVCTTIFNKQTPIVRLEIYVTKTVIEGYLLLVSRVVLERHSVIYRHLGLLRDS